MIKRIREFLPSSFDNTAEKTAFLCLAGSISLVLVSIAISQILLAPALIASAWAISFNRRFFYSLRWILLPLIVIFIWTIVTALMAPDIALAFSDLKKFYLFLLIPFVPIITRGLNRVWWIYKAIFTVALFSTLVGIGQYIVKPEKNDLLDRICGLVSHWMTYSGLLMLALVLLIAYGVHARWSRYFIWIPAALLIALAIVLSQTRNAILGVYIGVFVLLVLAIFIEKKRRYIVFTLCFILFSAALYIAAPESIKQRFRSGLDPNNHTTAGRIELAETSVRMIRENPWFGVGPNNVWQEALKYRGRDDFLDWMYQHMHNNFLQIAVEKGIPGLILWLWLMIRFAWDGLRTYRFAQSEAFPYGEKGRWEATLIASAALGCWTALMIAGMMEYNFGDSEVLTLFLFIMSAPYAYSPDIAKSAVASSASNSVSNEAIPDF